MISVRFPRSNTFNKKSNSTNTYSKFPINIFYVRNRRFIKTTIANKRSLQIDDPSQILWHNLKQSLSKHFSRTINLHKDSLKYHRNFTKTCSVSASTLKWFSFISSALQKGCIVGASKFLRFARTILSPGRKRENEPFIPYIQMGNLFVQPLPITTPRSHPRATPGRRSTSQPRENLIATIFPGLATPWKIPNPSCVHPSGNTYQGVLRGAASRRS